MNIMKKEKLPSLITTKELNEVIGNPKVKIFDVTSTFLDWRKEFIQQDMAPNLAQISSFEEAKQSFEQLGIDQGDIVILYDDYYHMFAGRVWWSMRYWGFENVHVLNGGFKHWQSQDLPVSQELPEVSLGTFIPVCQAYLRVPMADFLTQKDNACVLDGRGIAGYKGKPEDPRTGHIPGAINAAYDVLVNKETGLFLEKEQLIALFDKAVPNWRTEKIISSCGGGYSGTVAMLALAHLGAQSSLFDESFSVWKLDPNRPVEQS